MTKQDRNQLIVGIVFFTAMIFLGVYTILISGLFKGPQKTYLVSFPRIYGLKKGDQVRVEGLDRGEVTDLRLNESATGETQIFAHLRVSTDVEIFRDDSEVKVTPFSPLGGRIIEIKRGHNARHKYSSEQEQEKAMRVPKEKREFAFLSEDEQDEVQASTPRAKREYEWIHGAAEGELLQTLNALVDENRSGIARIVSNLSIVSTRLTQTDNVIGALINDPVTGQSIKDMSGEMRDATYSLNRILKRIEKGQGIVGELVAKQSPLHDNVNGAAAAARGALEQANTLLVTANKGDSALGVFVSDNPEVTKHTKAIVGDIALVTSDIAAGNGSLGKLVRDPKLYDGAAVTAENLGKITTNLTTTDPTKQSAVGVLLNDPETGARVRSTLSHLEAISRSVDSGQGALGLVVKDAEFRNRVNGIFSEVDRLVVEFRDSVEDLREQAPVNAFLGAVFAAF